MGDDSKPVFVREATGLVKKVTFLDSIMVNLANMAVGAGISIIGFVMVLFTSVSGVNLVYASIIAWLLTVPQVVMLSTMVRRIARTGGDYVWTSRSLGGLIGGTFAFTGTVASVLPYIAILVLSTVFSIGSVGLSLGYSSLLGLALPGNIPGSLPLDQFALGALIFGAIILVHMFSPRLGFKMISAMMIIGVLSLVVAMLTLESAGRQGVVNYMDFLNSIGANSTYSSVAASYSGPSFNLSSTLMMVPFFALFFYPFINAIPVVGSELKGSAAKNWGILVSSLFAVILTTVTLYVLYDVAGLPFTNAAMSNPKLVFDYSLNFFTLAMGVTSNTAVAWFIGLGWIIWNAGAVAMSVVYFSRYVLAQSFDRLLPERLAYVSEKYGSPRNALLVCFVVVLALVGAIAFYYGALSSLSSALLGSIIYFAVVGVGAAVYGLKKEKGGTRTILVITGLLTAAVFAYLASLSFSLPALYGGTTLSYGYVLGSFILGIALYFGSKSYYSKKGVNIDLVFKEIPPD